MRSEKDPIWKAKKRYTQIRGIADKIRCNKETSERERKKREYRLQEKRACGR